MLSDIDTSEHAAARPDFVKEALAAWRRCQASPTRLRTRGCALIEAVVRLPRRARQGG